MTLKRSYKIKLYPNFRKAEGVRYTYRKHLIYVNDWSEKLFLNGNESISTAGLGQLSNQAQHKARGIVNSLFALQADGQKVRIPTIKQTGCPAKVEMRQKGKKKKATSFEFWVSVEDQFSPKGRMVAPGLSHGKLNDKLRKGWKLNSFCEVVQKRNKQGKLEWFAIVFLQKEKPKAIPKEAALGCDVGFNLSVVRSDGYFGKKMPKEIKKAKQRLASRQSNKARGKIERSRAATLVERRKSKTRIKQLLDVEAKAAVASCLRRSLNLMIESPNRLANLAGRNLHGWAPSYFGSRCRVLAEEAGVWVWEVNPSNTSRTCAKCDCVESRSRSGRKFLCVACGHADHADANAAKNIARKGTSSLERVLSKRSGGVKCL